MQHSSLLGIKLHHLRYFVVLAEELHFGRAAQRLAITQPPLSGAIKSLEETLGVRLLERDSKQVQVTPAGAAFYTDAMRILESLGRAADTTRAVASGQQGRLEVGVTGSQFYREAPEILARFRARLPRIEVTLREVATSAQIDALLHGALDVGFMNAATLPPRLEALRLRSEVFVCCVPEAHPLAGEPTLDLGALAEEPFVMFSREVAPENHDSVVAILRGAGISPRLSHAARQWLTVLAMVANNLGVALVPESLSRTGLRGVRFVPILQNQRIASSRAVLAWNEAHISAAAAQFVDCAREFLAPAGTVLPA
jgi:DNA-binding transcriptional LysR family regulator